MALYQGDKLMSGIVLNPEVKSAYQAAIEGGYEGTEEEFNAKLAEITSGGSGDSAVLYTEQILTEEQKAQARANIGVDDINVLTRGPIIITESGTFDATQFGLKVGDPINVICVGGGGATSYSIKSASWNHGYGAGQNGATTAYAGGGSGYVAKKTIILDTLEVPVTIGAGGNETDKLGKNTSFGSYLSAQGGKYSISQNVGGEGGNYGENSSTGNPYGTGKGGVGFINDGLFSVASASQSGLVVSGQGAVFIWY